MSTNHTEHYNLSQWEATDKVLRADFNADNAKIDAALAGKLGRMEIITEMKLPGLAQGINSDSSAVFKDWEYVAYLVIYPEREGATATTVTYSLSTNDSPQQECVIGTLPYGPVLIILWPHHDGDTPVRGLALGKELTVFKGSFPISQTYNFYLTTKSDKKVASPHILVLGQK